MHLCVHLENGHQSDESPAGRFRQFATVARQEAHPKSFEDTENGSSSFQYRSIGRSGAGEGLDPVSSISHSLFPVTS